MIFRQLVVLFFIGLLSECIWAKDIQLNVSYHEGVYTLEMNLLVSGDSRFIHQALTDYNHLEAINPAIQKSELLGEVADGAKLVSTKIKGCVLFFCKTMQRVEKVYDRGNGVIESVILPEQSDFSFGESVWIISPEGDHSNIHYRARLKPDFSVLPGIGPALVKHVMRRELRHTAEVLNHAK